MTWIVVIILGVAYSMPTPNPETCFSTADNVIAWTRQERLAAPSIICVQSDERPPLTRDLLDYIINGDA